MSRLFTSIAGEDHRPSRIVGVILDDQIKEHMTHVVKELQTRHKPSLSFHVAALENVGLRIPDHEPVMKPANGWPEISASACRAAGRFLRWLADAGATFHHDDNVISGHADLCHESRVLTINLFSAESQPA